jgi:hypothetical protein
MSGMPLPKRGEREYILIQQQVDEMTARQQEIDANLQFFLAELPRLLSAHRGKFALLRHGKIEGFYDTVMDAVQTGNKLFDDKIFSVQKVTDTGADLGYYSHAVHLGDPQSLADISRRRNH